MKLLIYHDDRTKKHPQKWEIQIGPPHYNTHTIMTLKEFTDWVKGIALVKELINPTPPPVTPPKPPRKPRKPRKPPTEDS